MPDVVIVGAGLAGLACAARLSQAGTDFLLLEATDRVGGRVRTDIVEQFQLDHGFQFLSRDYPACQWLLDYDQLRLRNLDPHVLVRTAGHFEPLASGILSRILSGDDSVFRSLGCGGSISAPMLRCILRGEAAVPADGMGAIPRQLADRLPRGSLALQRTVVDLRPGGLQTSDGESLDARVVVLATESPAADRLTASLALNDAALQQEGAPKLDGPWESAHCLYFAADAPAPELQSSKQPRSDRAGARLSEDPPSLMLCGDESAGPISHVVPLGQIASEYAPPGRTLVSVTLAGGGAEPTSGQALLKAVRDQLRSWFGEPVDRWSYLRGYRIPYAVPVFGSAAATGDADAPIPAARSVEPFGDDGPIVCGDHRETGTIQGAMNSGLRAAEVVARRLG